MALRRAGLREIRKSNEDYQGLLDRMDKTSFSKEAKLESIITSLNGRPELAGFLTEIISTNPLTNDAIKEINQYLTINGMHYDVNEGKIQPFIGHIDEEKRIGDELNGLLKDVKIEFVKMREGAWKAFTSGTKDSYRQCVVSFRELLRQVIDSLATHGNTRKEKVRSILRSKIDVELVESIANIIDKLYNSFSKQEHTAPTYLDTIFTIKISEYVLHYMLRKRQC